jgi:hypothetical protein
MGQGYLGFAPTRIDRGRDVNVLAGTQGELLKIDERGTAIGKFSLPFPAPSIDGVVLDDRWVGIWLDREFSEARMAALPLGKEWVNGPTREELRLSSALESHVNPECAMWERTLDSEPMKMGRSGDNIVFSTFSGIYMIDKEAREIWRGGLPIWPEISKIGVHDRIVGLVEFQGGLAIWSQAGGISVIDPANGAIIYSRIVSLRDRISEVAYHEDGGWMIMLHGSSIGLMEKIEGGFSIIDTEGPVFDSRFQDGTWNWTGWRHDGLLTDGRARMTPRDDIGVAILRNKVLTNDGQWSEIRGYSD